MLSGTGPTLLYRALIFGAWPLGVFLSYYYHISRTLHGSIISPAVFFFHGSAVAGLKQGVWRGQHGVFTGRYHARCTF